MCVHLIFFCYSVSEKDKMKTESEGHPQSYWGPEAEHFPELVIEAEFVKKDGFEVQGRRIVNISHVMKQMEAVGKHSLHCTTGSYKLKSENISGIACSWTYFCDSCERHFVVTSEPLDTMNDVNRAVVWGSIAIGNGYSQTEEFFSVLDLPMMSEKKFGTEELKIEEVSCIYDVICNCCAFINACICM